MGSFYKKFILVAALTIIITLQVVPSGINFLSPQKAEATVPVATIVDIPSFFLHVLQVAYNYLTDQLWPILRDIAAKKITDYITQQTLDYINNGTTPTFVGNWSQFANDAGNIAFDSFNSALTKDGVGLCSPFVPQLQIMLKNTFVQQQNLRCTVDDFKRNIQNSLTLVQNGGFISYTQAFMPGASLVGSYVVSENQIIGNAISQKNARINEAVSASGFLGQKTCAQLGGGITEQDITDQCGTDAACKQTIESQWCTSWDVKTPGDVAAKAVANAITSDTQWAANIQSFTSAIVNALINKLFQKGLSSLKGSSATSDYGGGDTSSLVTQFNSMKTQTGGYYQDVIYYMNSADYPTLQTWTDVQMLALEGATGTSSTPACSAAADWQAKADATGNIVSGIQTVVNDAQTNLDDLNSVDPSTLSAGDLAQKVQGINDKFNTFQTNYQSLISDVEQAKQNGDMTDTEKTAIAEKNNLTISLTPPSCGPTEIPSQ